MSERDPMAATAGVLAGMLGLRMCKQLKEQVKLGAALGRVPDSVTVETPVPEGELGEAVVASLRGSFARGQTEGQEAMDAQGSPREVHTETEHNKDTNVFKLTTSMKLKEK